MRPITFLQSPFPEKFGVPRQSLLVEDAIGEMTFPKNDFYSEAFREIESSSHLWLIFEFHLIPEGSETALVRPPRFEGKRKLGVFATRSPHRPNRLGLSVVKLEKLETFEKLIKLTVSGVDLVDGTPIYDIKPYVPYADRIENAVSPFTEKPHSSEVAWLVEAPTELRVKSLIEKVISLDPRPAQDQNCLDEFGVSLAGHNIRFRQTEAGFVITAITELS
jgi:tRNA-Thr(GGU) m(6)t(6)A37 methyltransferase TsaA